MAGQPRRRKRAMGLHLIMTSVYAATALAAAPGCSWAHPGANPYRGDPVAALADFDLRDDTRRKLHALMAAHETTDIATITRDTIVGHADAEYADLREMHSGHGQVCHGAVDRSAWSAQRHERALVYCADGVAVAGNAASSRRRRRRSAPSPSRPAVSCGCAVSSVPSSRSAGRDASPESPASACRRVDEKRARRPVHEARRRLAVQLAPPLIGSDSSVGRDRTAGADTVLVRTVGNALVMMLSKSAPL